MSRNGLVFILMLVAVFTGIICFVSVKFKNEQLARKEAVRALYANSWSSAVREKVVEDSVWPLIQMPESLKAGFVGFAVEKVTKNVAYIDKEVEEFIDSMPKKGIGVDLGITFIGADDDPNPKLDTFEYGVRVYGVFQGSPALRAGLCEGDTIVSIDGEAMHLTTTNDMASKEQSEALVSRAVTKIQKNDQTLVLQVERQHSSARGGKPQVLTIRISERNAFDRFRDRETLIHNWKAASQYALGSLTRALKVGEDVSTGIDKSNTPTGIALSSIIARERDLKDIQESYMRGLELARVDKCKS